MQVFARVGHRDACEQGWQLPPTNSWATREGWNLRSTYKFSLLGEMLRKGWCFFRSPRQFWSGRDFNVACGRPFRDLREYPILTDPRRGKSPGHCTAGLRKLQSAGKLAWHSLSNLGQWHSMLAPGLWGHMRQHSPQATCKDEAFVLLTAEVHRCSLQAYKRHRWYIHRFNRAVL